MTGTFASFNTALSALRYQQIAMDVASNNVANATTEGFVRRRAEAVTVGAPTQTSMWSRSSSSGDGVGLGSLQRIVDPFLDLRSRREHGKQAFLDTRVTVLSRVESGVGEPGKSGVSAAMDSFSAAWDDLGNHPDTAASRSQVIATGVAVADALRAQSSNLTSELSDQRNHLMNLADEVSATAADLAAINRNLAAAQFEGTGTNDLLDQRDLLTLRLSELTGAVGTERPDGGMDVTVNGVSLVSGSTAGQVTVISGVAPDGSSDGAPLSLGITVGATTTPLANAAWGGQIGAVAELVTITLPDYLAGLDAVAKTVADSVNSLHTGGYDADGNPGVAFFTYDPAAGAAASLRVALTDPDQVAASSLPGGVLDGGNADALAEGDGAASAYQRLVNGLGSTVQSATRLAQTQQLLTTQVDSSREQLTGVNLDEETINLLVAQRSYEAASKVMSVLDSVLDTLINRTGVTR
ncbi:flagellar hook-associated protein FlgK [Nocardioides pantholopis]|uniref:flagellar hook-associated protein FlgK n=1 Tax=Nocardioides pantholopis TaxID=2483798 RepID=UPI000FD88D85|nr:flagellar hook-associated protein FlgK [Nocardioides pantholopis]